MTARWHGPDWLEPAFGETKHSIFHRVISVRIDDREVPELLPEFRYLEQVRLVRCKITKSQLERLQQSNIKITMTDVDVVDEAPAALAACGTPHDNDSLVCAPKPTKANFGQID